MDNNLSCDSEPWGPKSIYESIVDAIHSLSLIIQSSVLFANCPLSNFMGIVNHMVQYALVFASKISVFQLMRQDPQM